MADPHVATIRMTELAKLGPCIIGATGGSGTRAVARIVRRGGIFLGSRLNVAEDSLDLAEFLDRWINAFVLRAVTPPSHSVKDEISQDFNTTLEKHLANLDGTVRWGWKEPRNMYLLPFFHDQFGNLKFLHVVRDGRDMAFSSNQNQLRKHGSIFLDPEAAEWPQPLQSIMLWSRINLISAEYAEKNLSGRYLRVRFEDLCAWPVLTIRQIFDFLELEGDVREIAKIEVRPPDSLGRWKKQNRDLVAELHRAGAIALETFGYSVPKPQPVLKGSEKKIPRLTVKEADSAEAIKPEIVCLLGMHRSGTSLVSRVLNSFGMYLGPEQHLMQPNIANPKGFWENDLITELNDEILSRLGGSWHEPPTFPAGWHSSPEMADLRAKARALIQDDFGGAKFWGWKDPRTCLTLEFWQRLLPEIKYIICLRNPVDVARSLERRDGSSFEKGINLWLTHVTSAMEYTAGESRLYLFYEDLMACPKRELQRVARFLDREDVGANDEFQRTVEGFMDEEQRHYDTSIVEVADEPNLSFPVKALYIAYRFYLQPLQEQPDEGGNRELSEALETFGSYSLAARTEVSELRLQTAQLQTTAQALQQALDEKEHQVTQLTAQREQLTHKVAEFQATVRSQQETLARKDEQLAHMSAERDRLIQESNVLKAEVRSLLEGMEQKVREIYELHHSESYRFGLVCLWPLRQLWKFIRGGL